MRKVSLLGLLATANFATAGLGQYIGGENGKLSISNIPPVLFMVVATVLFSAARQTLHKNVFGFLALFNALGWLSLSLFTFKYGWEPNIAVLMFQEVEIVFCLLLIWYARNNYDEFRAVARFGTLCSAAISMAYGWQAIQSGSFVLLIFGMDDKSQAAVLFCCQAFILLRFFGKPLDCIVAGILMLMSLTTFSREPFFFVPVMFFALAQRSKIAVTIVGLGCSVVIAVVLSSGNNMVQLFGVFERISSFSDVSSDSATSAHLLLLRTAIQLKFYDATTFLFGSGAGNFSKALTSFPIDLQDLMLVDPTLVSEARVGKAPMHSTPFSAFLDYNFVLFCLLGYLLMRAVRYMVRSGKYMELAFFASLFVASMFYSLHNKPYLFLLSGAIVALMSGRAVPATRSGTPTRRVRYPNIAVFPRLGFAPGDHAKGTEYGDRHTGEQAG